MSSLPDALVRIHTPRLWGFFCDCLSLYKCNLELMVVAWHVTPENTTVMMSKFNGMAYDYRTTLYMEVIDESGG